MNVFFQSYLIDYCWCRFELVLNCLLLERCHLSSCCHLLQFQRHQPFETHNIRPPHKAAIPVCSMCFSPHSVSKTHEQHFDQQNGNELFVPTLSVIPFLSCQVSSKIVKQCQSPLPLWQSYCWSRWILSDLRGSTVLCCKASINKSFSN